MTSLDMTLVFMTARRDPRLDWVMAGLASSTTHEDDIELIVVDFFDRSMTDLVPKGFDVPGLKAWRVVPPMPNIWQGPHRVTRDHWWATSTARNTALVYASRPYIAFIDDRCFLGPEWMATVRRYRHEPAVLIGSYDKHEDGRIVSADHRRMAHPHGKRSCPAGWLYGCSFALPLEWALGVNGFEDGCNGLTGEDYIFGLMLGNCERRLDFVPSMFVQQDRANGNVTCKGTYRCMDKGVSPNDKSHAALERFGSRMRTEFTPDLRALRVSRDLAFTDPGSMFPKFTFPIPDSKATYLDWFDGQDIRTMV